MPKHQGALDGLCGPYAIANAFDLCGIDDNDLVFQTACSGIAQSRWPKLLWSGTTIGDLTRMIAHCRENIDGAHAIKVSYPFLKDTPSSNDGYWRRFDEIFDMENPVCAIIGLDRPSSHWIVASRELHERRVIFVDSDPHAPIRRRNRSSLWAGVRNGNPRVCIIDRSAFILFEKI